MRAVFNYFKYALLIVSFGIFITGILCDNFTTMLLGVMTIFLSNIVDGFLKWKTHIIFVFFHFTIFTFLLSRPFISIFKGYEWWHLGEQATKFSMFALFITLLCLRIGADLIEAVLQKNNRSIDLQTYNSHDKSNFLYSLRFVSLVLFYITFVVFLLCEAEKLFYMQGRDYAEYYLTFESRLPSFFQTVASMMKYVLCIYLATMPTKKQAFITLALYVLSAIPSLIIGIRNPIVLNGLFAFVYYLLRDIFDNSNRWFGKIEKIAVIVVVPLGILFLSAYNYIREDVSVQMHIGESIVDFFYKQGVSFDTICKGYNAIPDLPNLIEKNYTFGGIFDYITRGNIGQKIFDSVSIGNQNSEIVAIYSNSFAHSLSYVVHPGYLEGHGVGSSYIIETFADWGYVGVALFSLIMGAVMALMVNRFGTHPLISTIILVCLTSLFFTPRAEATGWITFLFTLQFWIATFFCYFLAIIICGRSPLGQSDKKYNMLKRGRYYA